MKATTLLEHQQRNLQELCDAVEHGSASVRASLLPQLASDLAAHMAVKEQVFYPAACAALHEDELLGSCHSQKLEARESLHRALGASLDGEEFTRAIGDLRGLVERHAHEEEDQLFPRLERALDSTAMRELGVSMLALYDVQVEADYIDD